MLECMVHMGIARAMIPIRFSRQMATFVDKTLALLPNMMFARFSSIEALIISLSFDCFSFRLHLFLSNLFLSA